MFCPKCGSLLKPKIEKNKVILVCPKCGYTQKKIEQSIEVKEKVKTEDKEIAIVEDELENMPVVKAQCPACGNDKALFWTVQTRAADEPETRFYRCTKCGYTWREYE